MRPTLLPRSVSKAVRMCRRRFHLNTNSSKYLCSWRFLKPWSWRGHKSIQWTDLPDNAFRPSLHIGKHKLDPVQDLVRLATADDLRLMRV